MDPWKYRGWDLKSNDVMGQIDEVVQILCLGIHDPYIMDVWGETTIYPRPERLANIQGGLAGEFMGLSQAGKSTVHKALAGMRFPPDTLEVSDEFPGMLDLEADVISFLKKGDLEEANRVYETLKLQVMRQTILDQLIWHNRKKITGEKGFKHKIVYRSANDLLAFTRILIPGIKPTHDRIQEQLQTWVEAMWYAGETDFVILWGITFEEAVHRRILQGLPAYGRIVNPDIWPLVARGYDWWRFYMFKELRDRFGIGLLTIDGTKSAEHNLRRVKYYVRNCVKLYRALHPDE
ncbi:MAG TPA: hypothetical protein VLI92_04465 [Candidatus Saccharimonadales bacterium]|nr:hypothetical protein [Candidatus Saccharimonadales bacterium]